MAKIEAKTNPDEQKLILNLQNMEHEAYRLGLFATARKINETIQKAGWDIADKIERETKRN